MGNLYFTPISSWRNRCHYPLAIIALRRHTINRKINHMKKLLLFLLLIPAISFCQNKYDVKAKTLTKKDAVSSKSSIMGNFKSCKMVDWKPGMRFISAQDIMTSPIWLFGLYPEDIKNVGKDLHWKIFIYEGRKQISKSYPGGNYFSTILTFKYDGDLYRYEYHGDTIQMRSDTILAKIHQLIYLDEVDKAKELLLNKKLFVKTDRWLYTNDQGEEQYSFDNQKYIAVTVKNIGLGTQDGPVKIIFSPLNSDKEYCLDVRFSGINKDVGIFGIDFDDAFQFENPKNEFPNISATDWMLIQNGKVKIGMGKKECILSWGKPEKINKTILGNVVSEQWVYSTSSYLYFKNGILTSIQN